MQVEDGEVVGEGEGAAEAEAAVGAAVVGSKPPLQLCQSPHGQALASGDWDEANTRGEEPAGFQGVALDPVLLFKPSSK